MADLLLQLLTDSSAAEQIACREDADVAHRHAGIGEGAEDRFGAEVDDVLVEVLAEFGHVDPQDPGVVTCAHEGGSLRCVVGLVDAGRMSG